MTTNVSSAARRRRIGLALGALEREQHPPPDLERILQRLQAGRDPAPLVVAEVRVGRAGGDDQEVVVERAVGEEQAIAPARSTPTASASSTSTFF